MNHLSRFLKGPCCVICTLQTSPQKLLGKSVKFHMECSNDPGHMTKIAAMHIHVHVCGENFYKYSSSETIGRCRWNFVYSIGHSSTTKFAQMMTLSWPFHTKVNFSSLCICIWEKALMLDYSETIEMYGIKVGIYSKLNEYMEIYMYQRSRSFCDLCTRSLRFH